MAFSSPKALLTVGLPDTEILVLSCGHSFCIKCIDESEDIKLFPDGSVQCSICHVVTKFSDTSNGRQTLPDGQCYNCDMKKLPPNYEDVIPKSLPNGAQSSINSTEGSSFEVNDDENSLDMWSIFMKKALFREWIKGPDEVRALLSLDMERLLVIFCEGQMQIHDKNGTLLTQARLSVDGYKLDHCYHACFNIDTQTLFVTAKMKSDEDCWLLRLTIGKDSLDGRAKVAYCFPKEQDIFGVYCDSRSKALLACDWNRPVIYCFKIVPGRFSKPIHLKIKEPGSYFCSIIPDAPTPTIAISQGTGGVKFYGFDKSLKKLLKSSNSIDGRAIDELAICEKSKKKKTLNIDARELAFGATGRYLAVADVQNKCLRIFRVDLDAGYTRQVAVSKSHDSCDDRLLWSIDKKNGQSDFFVANNDQKAVFKLE